MKNDIYTLAHEIRNPLSVVKGYLEMLQENNVGKYKRIIQDEVNVSLEILNSYLEYDKMEIVKEEMDLNLLLLDIKKSFKDYLKKHDIKIHLHTIDDEVYINADYQKLKEVFYNLIKNSIESKSKNIYIDYHIMFGRVIICFKNDGEMMDDDTILKIGNFYSSKTGGNGIGTTLSKKIIELHRGKIKFRNNKNMGISVYITLSLS